MEMILNTDMEAVVSRFKIILFQNYMTYLRIRSGLYRSGFETKSLNVQIKR
jgi:hypothetical protein